MPDITYGVQVEYVSTGSLSLPSTSGIERAMTGFKGIHAAASSFNSVLDSILGSIAHVATSAATGIGTVMAGGLALAVHQAVKFNREMEDIQVGLAAVSNSNLGLNGFSSSGEAFANQFGVAGEVIKQMRKDARELPGEFGDLQNMMSLMMPAASNAGLNMLSTEKMAANAMAIAAMIQVPFATAGREMGMIISGHVTGRMPMFTKLNLGDSTAWNKLTQDERLKKIKESQASMAPGIAALQNNWSTVSSNFVDNLKMAVGIVGGPLIDRVKSVLKAFNSSDKSEWVDIGHSISKGLVKAFDWGEKTLRSWIPIAKTFADTLYNGFKDIFHSIRPLFDSILPSIKSFMQDPRAFHKIEVILGQLLALRVGGGILSAGAGLASMAPAGMAALGGGAAGATALAEIAIPAAAALAVVAIAAYGFTSALTDSSSSLHGAALSIAKSTTESTDKLRKEMTGAGSAFKDLTELFGVSSAFIVGGWITSMAEGAHAINWFSNAISAATNKLWTLVGIRSKDATTREEDALAAAHREARRREGIVVGAKRGETFKDVGSAKAAPPHTTHIHKVEIKVAPNADPSRVAREVAGLLRSDAMFPKTAAINPAGRFNRQ